MKKWPFIYLLFMLPSQTISNECKDGICGYVNGQPVGRCVAGFCLPKEYVKLEPPSMEGVNQIGIETEIMDVLMVSTSGYKLYSAMNTPKREHFIVLN